MALYGKSSIRYVVLLSNIVRKTLWLDHVQWKMTELLSILNDITSPDNHQTLQTKRIQITWTVLSIVVCLFNRTAGQIFKSFFFNFEKIKFITLFKISFIWNLDIFGRVLKDHLFFKWNRKKFQRIFCWKFSEPRKKYWN